MPEQTSFLDSRADQIYKAFCQFHQENPHIWKLFEKFTLQLIAAGRTRYSGYCIFERIRWHVDVETTGESVKLNNNFRPYYGRMFQAKHPEYAHFFATRKRTSESRPAYPEDIQFFYSGAPGSEEILMAQLRSL